MANPHPVSRKGKPNKASTSRIERAVQQGRRLPHEALLLIAERALEAAAEFQPGTEAEPNEKADLKEFSHWLDKAREAYNNAAPYYAPRLAAVAVAANVAIEEHNVDPRDIMWETYIGMRRRGELAQKTIEAKAETGTISSTPVPEPAEVKEDDTDGEAA
jgi:hypothetical protein